MPVTAKLSQLFYERLGDQITNELVDWLNLVDTQYRSDLRELNEHNFARFSAEMGQRFAEHDARLEQRFAALEAKWEQRFAALEAKWEQRFAELEAKMDRRFAELEVKIERRFTEQTRFLYLALAAQIFLILGLYLR